MLGPVIGGQLVDAASWRWIFAINVPVVVITIILILRVVPQARERDPNARVDVVGALLCALGLAGMTFGLIEQPLRGWGDPIVALPLVIGALLFAGFLVWEARARTRCCRWRCFGGATSRSATSRRSLMYGGLGLLFFFLVLFLQQVAGFSALAAGSVEHPGDDPDVPAVAALRGAGRPPRAALLHGRGAAGRGGRDGAASCASTRTSTTSPTCCPGLLVFGARAVDDRRAADGDRAGRRRRVATRASRRA